jgi:hypothetical protein
LDTLAQEAYSRFLEVAEEEARLSAELARRGPFVEMDEGPRFAETLALWIRGSETLAAICRGLGITYVHVLQPTPHDTFPSPSKPLTDEEHELIGPADDPWAQSAHGLYPEMRAAAPELRRRDVTFADLSRVFESETRTIYYDICHLNQLGNELLADSIAMHYRTAMSR